jgi:hypothetical protein
MRHKIKFDEFNYLQLDQLGHQFNLTFSRYITLGNKIIGLDIIKRKLLIAEKNNGLLHHYFIELNKVGMVTIQTIYDSIKAGELKKKRIREFLRSIQLQFRFRDGDNTIVLPFYERTIDDIHNLKWLESKARNWHMILSNMLPKKIIGPLMKKDQDKSSNNQLKLQSFLN